MILLNTHKDHKNGHQILVATPKIDGRIRLCLDAREINSCIQRETYTTPTWDPVIGNMAGATFFSKIDMKEA